MNSVALMGRIGNDLEVKESRSGTDVLRFSLAVRNPFAKDESSETDWIRCVAFNKQAQFIAQYFHKGEMIAVTGRLQTSSYEDKDGNRRESTSVVVNSSDFCGSKSETGNQPARNAQKPSRGTRVDVTEDGDDLPF